MKKEAFDWEGGRRIFRLLLSGSATELEAFIKWMETGEIPPDEEDFSEYWGFVEEWPDKERGQILAGVRELARRKRRIESRTENYQHFRQKNQITDKVQGLLFDDQDTAEKMGDRAAEGKG